MADSQLPVQPDMTQSNITRRRLLTAAGCLPLLAWLPSHAEAASTIHELEGSVFINNVPAKMDSRIRAGDKIVVAHDGKLAVSIGGDAYLLRAGTALEIAARKGLVSGLRLLTGELLAVFGHRDKEIQVQTHIATIGIRGTAIYLNANPTNLYACTCYGSTDLRFGRHTEHVNATHHSAYQIDASGGSTSAMQAMEVVGHSDDELRTLEGYVGRIPKFDQP